MTDAERILQLLIHDLRTPLGVAQGYVRLLQEQRLASVEERDQALVRTMQALGRLSHLCQEASRFLADDPHPVATTLPASALATRVDARIRDRQVEVEGVVDPAARLRVAGDTDRLAEAIDVVLGTVAGPDGKLAASVLMETRVSELRFVAMRGDSPTTGDGPRTPFDPWRGYGLGVPLACRVITGAYGQIWTVTPGVLVSFPLEVIA